MRARSDNFAWRLTVRFHAINTIPYHTTKYGTTPHSKPSRLTLNHNIPYHVGPYTTTSNVYVPTKLAPHLIAPKHKTNKHYLDLNSFDAVITQNAANLPIFTQYYKKPIDVIELPDFKKSNKLVKTANNEIVIGIIGAISIEKGRDILENIVNFYKDSNVTFIVFGYVEIKNFSNVYRYNNIKELNGFSSKIIFKIKQ